MSERILVAVDASPASGKSVEYVAGMVTARPDLFVHLMHVLPPVPPSAMAEGADTRKRDRWIEKERGEAREMLEAFRGQFLAAGVAEDNVDMGYLVHRPEATMVEGVLDAARDQDSSTIVVGRNSLPWYREAFHHHLADELVRKAEGFTVWIVE